MDNALKRLLDSDRATLREYVVPTSNDVDLALRRALAAAEKKQRYRIEKRWTFTFAGRKVTLKEEADEGDTLAKPIQSRGRCRRQCRPHTCWIAVGWHSLSARGKSRLVEPIIPCAESTGRRL